MNIIAKDSTKTSDVKVYQFQLSPFKRHHIPKDLGIGIYFHSSFQF